MGGGSIKIFRRKFFVSQCQKFRRVGGILYCCKNFGYRKSRDERGECQDFPSKTFCPTVPKNFVGEPFSVSLVSGTEKVWIREGWREYQDFPSKTFCPTVPKNFVGEPFSVSLVLGTEKVWIREGWREYQDFPSKCFCLTVPKISVRESFTVAITSGIKKIWIRGGGGRVSRFSVEFFLSHSAAKFRWEILYCCNNFGYRKSLDKRGRGVSRFSVEKFLSHSAENFRRGVIYCCNSFGYRESLDKRGGGKSIKILRRKVFVSQCRKFPWGNPLLLQ